MNMEEQFSLLWGNTSIPQKYVQMGNKEVGNGRRPNFSQAPEKDASSLPLQLFSVIELMVRREAAGEGVRGLEGADIPLPLLLGSALQATTSLLLSWDVLIICAQHALPKKSNQQSSTHI